MATQTLGTWSTGRRIAVATAVAGTLDILAAMLLTLSRGKDVLPMLRGVASGPFPGASGWGTEGSVLGLAVHFAIMAVIATVFVLAADRKPDLKARPLLWGVLYGLATYVVMNLIVVPLRFGSMPSLLAVGTQLFCHIVLVGIPIAFIARK
ncbi:MAG: hypothetical protein V4574_15155 [Pseudomonadota bacterium]